MLIQLVFSQPAVQAGIPQRLFPGWLESHMFQHFPVSKIDKRLRALALLFKEITQRPVKLLQFIVLQTYAIGRIAQDHLVLNPLEAAEIPAVYGDAIPIGEFAAIAPGGPDGMFGPITAPHQ